MADIYLRILISAQNSAANVFATLGKGLADVVFGLRNVGTAGTLTTDALASAGNSFWKLAGTAAAAVAIIGTAIGIEAVRAASDFQQSMLKVQAYAGMTKQQTDAMAQSILAMSAQLGVAPKALADSLYFVASAGFKGADALTVLRYAGMTAAAANVDASTTGFALVSSLNALGLGANQAGNITDELNATVKQGVMTWQQYGSVVGKIAGSVSAAGGGASMLQHNFMDLNAALDVYTNSGISARQASMWLSADMNILYGKAGTLATNAAKLGISFDATKYASLDFAGRLQYLSQITDGNRQELVKLVGGNSTVANSVQFLNNHYGQLDSTIATISGAMRNGASTQSMFAIASQGLNFKIEQMKASFQVLLITIGMQLIPVVSQVVGWVGTTVAAFTTWLVRSGSLKAGIDLLVNAIRLLVSVGAAIVGFFQHNQVAMDALLATLMVLGAFILGSMVMALYAWAAAAWAAAAANIAAFWPVYAVVGAIIVVITAVIVAIQHWGQIVSWLQGLWSGFSSWFLALWNGVVSFFTGLWSGVVSFFTGLWSGVVAVVASVWNAIVSGVAVAVRAIMTALAPVAAVFKAVFTAILYVVEFVLGLIVLAVMGWVILIAAAVRLLAPYFLAAWHAIAAGATAAWTLIRTVTLTAWNAVRAFLTSVWNGIRAAALTVWNALSAFFLAIWKPIQAGFTVAWNFIKALLVASWQIISSTASSVWNALSAFFLSFWNPIRAGFAATWSYLTSFLSGAWNTISGLARSIWSGISSTITGIVSNLASQLSNWFNQIVSAFQGAFNQLGGIATGIWNNVVGAFKFGVNAVIRLVNGIISDIDSISVSTPFGKIGFNIPQIPYLARGVESFGGGMAYVHQGEVLTYLPRGSSVVPANRVTLVQTGGGAAAAAGAARARPAVGEIHLHIHTQQLSDAEMNRAVRLLADKLRTQFGNL